VYDPSDPSGWSIPAKPEPTSEQQPERPKRP
jgi:hypothetical protein